MHIPDGLLPPSVAISSYAITGGITWFSLRQIRKQDNYQQQIPKASLLTAAFFVSSLIHIPIPPFSIHLILNGVMGLILGYYAFPAILIGLFFQAVFFQHGGLSTLGINAIIMGVPSLLAYNIWLCRKLPLFNNFLASNILNFFIGFIGIFLSALLFVFITINNISPDLNINMEKKVILASLIGYAIQGIIEGTLTVMLVNFFYKVKPEIINNQ
ncbi:substrate-specific component NikM of nickel ECF transporter [Geminocystis sp. NIES-3708]|uniref:cobalt transporter CbiM n=1 Tax=Geminocystis sp. NIES-3708 TaxID=1615909 RepID=UPI0005FC5590|nr:cobalt transporter CbiM [Geminocystis sp. NIES-3708]BAQ60293.1 substrate-specific component NikM of nickel ECF transporter [Geminocystis sp. NIES-3708]